jgi:hypothetical protein
MNPGYLSLLLICMTVILLSSGWKEVFLSRASHKEILLFFVLWIIGLQYSFFVQQVQVNGIVIVISLLCVYIFVRVTNWIQRVQIVLFGFLLAAMNFLLLEFYSIDPIFVISHMGLDIAIWLSILTICMSREANVQIASLSIGFIVGEVLYAYKHLSSLPIVLGSSLFQDKWWLALVIVRTTTVIMQVTVTSYKRFTHKFGTIRKRGWK